MRFAFAVVFAGLLAVWTWLLLKPQPVPESLLGDGFGFDLKTLHFVLAKCLHLSAYAFLATVGGLLPRTAGGRRRVWGGLALHGVATEFGQWVGSTYFDTGRYGCVRDVLIDVTGVAIGAGVATVVGRWAARRALTRG